MDGDGDTVTYSLSNNLQTDFAINPITGVIVLAQTLDRETQRTVSVLTLLVLSLLFCSVISFFTIYSCFLQFTVLAKDSGNLTSSAAFTVVVGDINDHTPYFPQNVSNLSFAMIHSITRSLSIQFLIKSVLEDAPVGIDNPLVTLTGNDSDDGDSLFYHLVVNNLAVDGPCVETVCIGRTSGRLYFNETLVNTW